MRFLPATLSSGGEKVMRLDDGFSSPSRDPPPSIDQPRSKRSVVPTTMKSLTGGRGPFEKRR